MSSTEHALASSRLAVGLSTARERGEGLGWRLPLWGMLLAAVLIISRRPDVITDAQFWAEDGNLYYADVYNHGLLATLMVPQNGYFTVLPTLAAGIAQFVTLASAPLVTNAIAILIRVLPVGLLLSSRAKTISPDIRIRGLLAALYIALPGGGETDGNIVNALWYLAIAATIVLMLQAPVSRFARIFDITIIALCSLTGVFAIVLAPLAFLYRRWRGAGAVSRLTLAILVAGAAIQLLAIFVLEYHVPSGFGAGPRPSTPLHPSIQGFFEILGSRVIAVPLLGSPTLLGAAAAALLGLVGAACAVLAFRRTTPELRLLMGFGGAVFAMALARPLDADWPGLTFSTSGARYFIIPQLAVIATLVWAVGRKQSGLLRTAGIGMLLYVALVTIPQNWAYSPLQETNFAYQAALFEKQSPGTQTNFELEPEGWSMTLTKH